MVGLAQARTTGCRTTDSRRERTGTRDAAIPDGRRWTHERTAADGRRPRPRPRTRHRRPPSGHHGWATEPASRHRSRRDAGVADSLDAVVGHAGRDRARYLMLRMLE